MENDPDASNGSTVQQNESNELFQLPPTTTNTRYEWCSETNQWITDPDGKYTFEDGNLTYTNEQGITYYLEKATNSWAPKIDDNFIAYYQMSYGFADSTNNNTKTENSSSLKDQVLADEEEKPQKKQKTEPSWFNVDDEHNTKVYVSNLPESITETEFVELMQKCGLVMKDPLTNKMKVKLYTDPDTKCFKGDALCTYIRLESVDLALQLLDGFIYKDHEIHVERAKFQMKGEYNPSLKPRKPRKKDLEKLKKKQETLFDWRPEKLRGERSKHERVVILKNVFDPKIFDENVSLILEYQEDIREECKKCGDVRKVVIYDRHPDGVVQVTMKAPEDADKCVELLNNRWFEKRRVSAAIWDGKTKYKVSETDSELNKRLDNWDKFLNEGDNAKSTSDKASVPIN